MSERHLPEHRPKWKLIYDSPPPIGTKIMLRTRYGTAIISQYMEGCGFVAWAGLPTYDEETKTRLEFLLAAGVDITEPCKT